MTAQSWLDAAPVDNEPDHDPWPAQAANNTPTAPFAALDLGRLGQPIPPPDWLVEDRIARQWLILLGAKPGIGKTWLGIDLALALTTGRPWLGHEVLQPQRVLYLDAENGADIALERIYQLGGRAEDIGDRLHYVTESIDLPTRDIGTLRQTVTVFRPDLVIIDTLASVAPTAERDTESSAAFLTAVWHLVRDAGAAMVLLVHLRKSMQGAGKDDQLDAFRGAGHLVGSAHRAWVLEPVTTDRPIFLMHDVKARRGHRLDTIRVQVVDDETTDTPTTRVEVDGTVAAVESGYDSYLATVLTYLDTTTLGEGKTGDLLLLPGAPAKRSATDYLTRAVASGVLLKPRRGTYARAGTPLPTPEESA